MPANGLYISSMTTVSNTTRGAALRAIFPAIVLADKYAIPTFDAWDD